MFSWYQIEDYWVLLRATSSMSWDMEAYGRTFHLTRDDEIRLLERIMFDDDVVLDDIRALNYTGKTISNVNTFEFTLAFLEQHRCVFQDQEISTVQAYIAMGGFPEIVAFGTAVTKREHFIMSAMHCILANISGFTLIYLLGTQISWTAIALAALLAGACAYPVRGIIKNTLQGYTTLLVLVLLCVVLGCMNRAGATEGFYFNMIGSIAYIGSVFATGIGTILFALMSLFNCIEVFDKK